MWLRVFVGGLALVCASCAGGGKLEVAASVDFGSVSTASPVSHELSVKNGGDQALDVAVAVDVADIVPSVAALHLAAGETSVISLTWTPRALGRVTGALSLTTSSGTREVALTGNLVGASMRVAPTTVSLGTVFLLDGGVTSKAQGSLRVRHDGSPGVALHVQAPVFDDSELCAGQFGVVDCQPWQPFALDAGAFVDLPLDARPTSAGERRWTVQLTSDDVFTPQHTVEVVAFVEQVEACRLTVPTELKPVGGVAQLVLKHEGSRSCVVTDVTFEGPFSLRDPLLFPVRLEPNRAQSVWVQRAPEASPFTPGAVTVHTFDGRALRTALVSEAQPSCLAITPSEVDFGTVKSTCNAPDRAILLYNVCATPVTVSSVWLQSSYVPPGAPGCSSPQACPEFFITSAPPPNSVLQPGASPLVFRVKYRPLGLGADAAALHVQTSAGEYLAPLFGVGGLSATFTDVFHIDPVPRADVLVMVDASPSFVPKRAGVRENLRQLMRYEQQLCVDVRWRFAAAEGAPGSTPAFLATDAGQTSFRPYGDAGDLEAGLAALDGMPVGSEVEACIGPAVRLLSVPDAGPFHGPLSGLCVTDALEQTPDASGAFADFRALSGAWAWSAVYAQATSTCAVEAVDDGVHQALSDGWGPDICRPDWWSWFVGFDNNGCALRTNFYLSQRPYGDTVQVSVDGVRVPAGGEDGGTPVWHYDPITNSVTFEPAFVPQSGSIITITADVDCP
jgi:hypothetical protein